MQELSPDTTLSHYRIVTKLGGGGMGEVYLAEDTGLERQVALKILLAEVAEDEDRVRRFVQEAKAASALNHPNILTVYEIGSFENSRFIATELIKGETLRERLQGEPLTLRETLDVAVQIASALNAAHSAGIVHRDIKPENVMLRDEGLVKVLDFGLAKLTEKKTEPLDSEGATRAQVKTSPGMVMGTVAYMSPEQARGKATDARSDIWSLAVVVYIFEGVFKDAQMWLAQANQLKMSADVIEVELQDMMARIRFEQGLDEPFLAFLKSFMLLTGMAVENLIKGILVGRNPSIVSREVIVLLRRKGHGISEGAKKVISVSNSEYELLRRLEEYLVWGRAVSNAINECGVP